MTKLLIITHGPLAEAFKESAEMFFGDTANQITAIGLYPTKNPDELKTEIEAAIEEVEDDYLFFVDIFAGTPFNMVAMAIEEIKETKNLECFTGINMPLLMEALASKEAMNLAELVEHIEETAPTTIVNMRKTLEL